MKGYIYEFRNKINDKYYVGQSTCPHKRYLDHKSCRGYRSAFHNAIQKYGFDNFEYSIVEEIDASDMYELQLLLNDAEIQQIKLRNSYSNGYNMTYGGQNIYNREKCSFKGETNPMYKSNRRHITNGKINKFVKETDLQTYLDNGWYIGYAPRDWSERNKKVSKATQGRQSPRKNCKLKTHTCDLLSKNMLGRVRLNNGIKNVSVKPEEVQYYLDNGYKKGMLKRNYKNIDI